MTSAKRKGSHMIRYIVPALLLAVPACAAEVPPLYIAQRDGDQTVHVRLGGVDIDATQKFFDTCASVPVTTVHCIGVEIDLSDHYSLATPELPVSEPNCVVLVRGPGLWYCVRLDGSSVASQPVTAGLMNRVDAIVASILPKAPQP